MQKRHWRFLLLFGVLSWGGCVSTPAPKPEDPSTGSTIVIQNQDLLDTLQFNLMELKRLYEQMQPISEGQLFYGSDEQLCIVQKSSLRILSSQRLARHQRELLSFSAGIQSGTRKDSIKILIDGLERSVFESASDLNALNTYFAFSDNETVREHIDRAVDLIQENMTIYKDLINELNLLADN